MNAPYAARTHEEMKPVLLEPKAAGPAIHYYMIRGGAAKSNVTVWEPGTVGGEYIKAFGHYHVDDLAETYRILSGEGVLLMQMRETAGGKPVDDRIASFTALRVKAGDVVRIPPRSGHALVNVGRTWLVTSDDSPWSANEDPGAPRHADYEPIRRQKGFAYYVIERDGAPALVRNGAYASAPDARIEDFHA